MSKDKAPIGRRKFLKGASLAGAAVLSARVAKAEVPAPEATPTPPSGATPVFSPDTPASSLVNPGKPMPNDATAAQIRDVLKLEPNQTCGYVRATYKSALYIAPGGLPAPFATGRPLGTALFFMVTPEEPVKLHRIQNVYGDTGRTGEAPPHPERSALSLLSGRPARGAAALRERHQ